MVSNYKTEFNNKAIEEQLGEYSLKLDTPRIDAETTMDYFQRLSIVAFYEPLRMEPYKDIRFATWAGWATKFFAHGSIAYLLYLDRTLATHSPAPDSPRSDIHVAQAPSPPSYRMPYPGRDTLPVPETSATYRATCQLVPIDPPTLSSVIGTCGVGPHESNAGTSQDETIRQLNIQNSVLQKQFKSLFTPSLHVALDRVRINSRGVPLSKYPLSERIRDTLAIATLPIGYYDYVLLQLGELTVFRRHTWLRQDYLATPADIPSATSSIYLDDQDFSLHSTAQDAFAIEGNILMAHEKPLHDLADASVIESILVAHEHQPHDTPPTQDGLRAPVEPATLFVGRVKSRWSVISPPSLRSIKAPFTPTKANRASITTRSEPCALGPEPVTVLRTSKHRSLGCRRTRTNGWLATRASSKGGPVSQEASAIDPVRNLRAVTEIYPSQVTAARVRVTDNPSPRLIPRKRAAQRLRRAQARKLHERLHSRQRPASLYRTGRPLAAPSKAVALYTRLLAHNRSRRQSVVDQDTVSEVVGPYRCIDVPVMDVSTVYRYMYYAYYATKRDEYSHVPAGIG